MGKGLKKLGPETGATEGVRKPTGVSALRSFINRKSIALLAALALMVGTGADVASAKTAKEINDPIVAFVFDVKSLMADVSLKSATLTKVAKKYRDHGGKEL